jgi:predicted CoA-binding protein
MDWNENVLASRAAVWALLRRTKRVAVLGVRPERMAFKPAHYLPAALQAMGLEIVPVPVVDRDVDTILGQPLYRALADAPGPIDIINVFRRAGDIPAHVADILAVRPTQCGSNRASATTPSPRSSRRPAFGWCKTAA